jgi:ABC-2 type transport system permease protein
MTATRPRRLSRPRAIWLVARREIVERVRSRGFILSLLFTQAIIIASLVLPAVFAGPERIRLGIVEPQPPNLEPAMHQIATAFEVENLELTPYPTVQAGEAALAGEELDALLNIPADLAGPGELIVRERPDDRVRAIVGQAVVGLRAQGAIVPPSIRALDPPDPADTATFILANAAVILLFISIFSFGYWVLTGVVEEKQSRVVEVVLSTVRARDLLMGKVLGIGLLGLGQLVIMVATGLLIANYTNRLELPTTTLPSLVLLFVWFILGFALYSTAFAVLGALASRMEEASNVTTPVTLLATAGYLIALIVVPQDPDGLVARLGSFFPPFAPTIVPLRAVMGGIEPWEILATAAVTIVTIYGLFVLGGRVYSGAILQVGARLKLRDAWRASR